MTRNRGTALRTWIPDHSNNLAIAAEALLAFGADPDAHDTPFDVAMDAEAKDVLAVLERYETRVESKR